MTLNVIPRLQAFTSAIHRTFVQYYTRFQLTRARYLSDSWASCYGLGLELELGLELWRLNYKSRGRSHEVLTDVNWCVMWCADWQILFTTYQLIISLRWQHFLATGAFLMFNGLVWEPWGRTMFCQLKFFSLHFYHASYALAVYAMAVCPSVCVCLSVCLCLSQVGVLLKWLNIGTRKQRHTIAQGL